MLFRKQCKGCSLKQRKDHRTLIVLYCICDFCQCWKLALKYSTCILYFKQCPKRPWEQENDANLLLTQSFWFAKVIQFIDLYEEIHTYAQIHSNTSKLIGYHITVQMNNDSKHNMKAAQELLKTNKSNVLKWPRQLSQLSMLFIFWP